MYVYTCIWKMSKILHIWSQRQIWFYVLNICVLTSYYTVYVRWVYSFVNVDVCHKAQMNLLNIFSSWLCTAILNFLLKILHFNMQDARNIVLYLVTIWHFLLKFYNLICKMQEITFFSSTNMVLRIEHLCSNFLLLVRSNLVSRYEAETNLLRNII